MKTEQVPSRLAALVAAIGGTSGAPLKVGQIMEARVIAALADGNLKLATRGGLIEALMAAGTGNLPQAGDHVVVEVGSADSGEERLTLTLRPVAGQADAARTAPPETAAALGRAVADALGRQGSVGEAFDAATQVADAPEGTVPEAARAAAKALLATRLPLDRAPSARDLAGATARSGIFLEARLATGEAPAADVKAALNGFRQALASAITVLAPLAGPAAQQGGAAVALPGQPSPAQGIASAASASPDARQGAGASALPPAGTAPLSSTLPGSGAASTVPQVPLAVPAQPGAPPTQPGTSAAVLAAPSAAQPGVANAMVSPAAPSSTPDASALAADPGAASAPPSGAAAAPRPAPSYAALLRGFGDQGLAAQVQLGAGTNGDAALIALQEAAPRPATDAKTAGRAEAPPIKGTWPSPEAPHRVSADATAAPVHSAEGLKAALAETDAAIARVVLDQYASLDRPAPDALRSDRGHGWSFDIPVALAGQTTSLRVQVDRDGHGTGGGSAEQGEPSWRLRLAFDIEPIGPVRAQIGLVGGRVAIGIWAERRETAQALGEQSTELRTALTAADFEIDEIHLDVGVPPDETVAEAGLFVERMA